MKSASGCARHGWLQDDGERFFTVERTLRLRMTLDRIWREAQWVSIQTPYPGILLDQWRRIFRQYHD